MDLSRIGLYARTLSHLKPKQIAYLVLRRLWPAPNAPAEETTFVQVRRGVSMQAPLVTTTPQDREHEFRFLNVSKTFSPGKVDWASTDMTKLWRYNLHYFDYVLDPGRSIDNISISYFRLDPAATLWAWALGGSRTRSRCASSTGSSSFCARIFVSMSTRVGFTAFTSRRDGWSGTSNTTSSANHYLKNGKALLYAGVFFDGADADRWLGKGSKILLEEAHEQILTGWRALRAQPDVPLDCG